MFGFSGVFRKSHNILRLLRGLYITVEKKYKKHRADNRKKSFRKTFEKDLMENNLYLKLQRKPYDK